MSDASTAVTAITNLDSPRQVVAPVGAFVGDDGVTFRVWAPKHRSLVLVLGAKRSVCEIACDSDPESGPGYFCARVTDVQAGDLYRYQIDGEMLPDPASRFQPLGVEGPSVVVDPARYNWKATQWRRPEMCGRVIYELHVGTFTPAGTFLTAIEKLDSLVDLGVNTIELMPLADFAGRWNWGYDAVAPFAPARCYGTPDELRALIDAAHQRRLAVVVDVVYNHLGPIGNVLPKFSDDYFRSDRQSGWGSALNFDGANSNPVRQYYLQNAAMWLDEYRVDGLRLDATHAIHDGSPTHIVAEIAAAAAMRGAFTIAEDDRNEAQVVTPLANGGWGVNAVWADDFHHVVRVGLMGERSGYYANYSGARSEWLTTLRDGWLYHGQYYAGWKRERGTPGAHLPTHSFVVCISNHDQVGNRPRGDRLHEATSPDLYRAASMLLCLAPYTPMIFQGQEWGASTPFPFFTDFPGAVGANMAQGRREEFERAGLKYSPADLENMPDPQDEATFRDAKLRWDERDRLPHAGILALYRDSLRMRAAHPVFQSCDRAMWTVLPHGEEGIAVLWNHPDGNWLLTMAPDGTDAPDVAETRWMKMLSSNDPRFGVDEVAPKMGVTLWRTHPR